MDKTYNPATLEAHWYQRWEQTDAFNPDQAPTEAEPYCIMIPPPNVTGRLHMGHGFQQTLMDTLIRYQRMCGQKTLWQMGTDHAGIATQMLVERQLQAEGQQTRHDLGREAFIDKVWQWKAYSGDTMSQQIRRLGASVDWSRERFTLDPGMSAAVQTAFIQLYEAGLIYRGKRLVNWDPVLQTAISDLEVIATPEQGHLWSIRYPLVNDPTQALVIATTRPETLLGDLAVAVHPEDPRYQALIGQQVRLPLCDRSLPIIADEYVDPDFGTGCVKITPSHDFNDYAVGQRHQLGQLSILDKTGHINDAAPAAYQGLERFTARKQILADLEAGGFLVSCAPHALNVPRGDRSNTVIEPLLTDQWFVNATELAGPALAAVATGELQFQPSNWANTYNHWLNNIEDWCISRQLWWGHRIPAWYDDQGKLYVGPNIEHIRAAHQLDAKTPLYQDEDVLDTWFSSALWPFATLGWPEKTADLKTFYPTQTLVTGFDILFFWVARMVMLGLKLTGEVPFKSVYITGLIRDQDGQKMSKSKGNVLDPIDLVDGISLADLLEKRTAHLMQPHLKARVIKATQSQFPEGIAAHGTDALRFTFCALASTGRDIRFDMQRLAGYRNFCNKLWNAARFVLGQCDDLAPMSKTGPLQRPQGHHLLTRWLHSQLNTTVQSCHHHLTQYRFDLLATTLYDSCWHTLCDWALELAKISLHTGSAADKLEIQATLLYALDTLLKCLHPIMPFITEDIWQRVAPYCHPVRAPQPLLMHQPFPATNAALADPEADANIAWLQAVVTAIRTIKAEMNIAPKTPIMLQLRSTTDHNKKRVAELESWLKPLCKITQIDWLSPADPDPTAAATTVVDQLTLFVPLRDLIDPAAEQARLEKALRKLDKELTGLQARLAQPRFRAQAPSDVVAKVEQRIAEITATQAKYKTQLQAFTSSSREL